jgi:hypothetical protein
VNYIAGMGRRDICEILYGKPEVDTWEEDNIKIGVKEIS